MFRLFRSKTAYLADEVEFLRAQVSQLQNYILMGAPAAIPQPQNTHFDPAWEAMMHRPDEDGVGEDLTPADWQGPTVRMYSTEEEEDIEFQREEGLIGDAEAARLLRQVRALHDGADEL